MSTDVSVDSARSRGRSDAGHLPIGSSPPIWPSQRGLRRPGGRAGAGGGRRGRSNPSGRCIRCTRTSSAPAIRRSRSCYRSSASGTAARSPPDGYWPSSTARRSSRCPRRSRWPRAASTISADAGRARLRRRCRRWDNWEAIPGAGAGLSPASRFRSRSGTSTTRRGCSGPRARAERPRTACGCGPRVVAGRPARARLRADLCLRHHPARLGADPPRAVRRPRSGQGGVAGPRHVVPPARSGPTNGSSTTTSPSASGGRGLAEGKIFARDGRHIVSVVQEGMLRVPSA